MIESVVASVEVNTKPSSSATCTSYSCVVAPPLLLTANVKLVVISVASSFSETVNEADNDGGSCCSARRPVEKLASGGGEVGGRLGAGLLSAVLSNGTLR